MADNPIVADPDVYYAEDADVPSDFLSETSSLSSKIYKGVIENGRRYQTIREDKYWSPSDDKQFESLEAVHLMQLVLDSETPNPLFHSPIGDSPKHILDIGTGKGTWAIDVADLYPDTVVRGVDLYPPPVSWTAPNSVFEVDDVSQEWTWQKPFDLVHMRHMIGAFAPDEWDNVYKQCYENLIPGGWIEQTEGDPRIRCDDGSLPEDNTLRALGRHLFAAADHSGRSLDTLNTMRAGIEKAGFVDVHEKVYKVPIGPWPKDPNLKEAGRLMYIQLTCGLEGYTMWLLTKHGVPTRWSPEEVQVYLAELRKQLRKPEHHTYQIFRRVWARKPMPGEVTEKTDEKVEKTEKSNGKADGENIKTEPES